MPVGMSAQGTLIARADVATPTNFTTVAQIMKITPPSLTRNAIETTSHNESEESFVVGIARKGELTFDVGFVPSGATHGNLAGGLVKDWKDGTLAIWKVTFPESTKWTFSGYVTNVAVDAPVDDLLSASITIRPTGLMTTS